jgi:two-component system response regulator RegA
MADEQPFLVIVEDDTKFAATLQRSFERRGYRVAQVHNLDGLEGLLTRETPGYAVVDLKLGTTSGLVCVQALHEHDASTLIVVLTGHASIATAVESIKLGASHYLVKPSNTDDIEAAFNRAQGDVGAPIPDRSTSLKTLEWERINEMLVETDFNISEAARRLGMHRRTLARKLEKRRIT